MRLICGWCGKVSDEGRCGNCDRDPVVPYRQRGLPPVTVEPHDQGRPPLDEQDIRRRYAAAVATIEQAGRQPTVDSLAEELDRSPRTVREWRKRFDLR